MSLKPEDYNDKRINEGEIDEIGDRNENARPESGSPPDPVATVFRGPLIAIFAVVVMLIGLLFILSMCALTPAITAPIAGDGILERRVDDAFNTDTAR